MLFSVKRFRSRIKTKAFQYLRCGAKTITFLFWATLYMIVMKMTIFKSNVRTPVKDWSMVPDNYTKWLVIFYFALMLTLCQFGVYPWLNVKSECKQLQGPVIGDDEPETINNIVDWTEPDNVTIFELEKRANKVLDVCRKRTLSSRPINNKEFFVDHAHNLVWCNIFKAASSSWLYNFNILGGYEKHFLARTRQTPLILARKKFPRPSEEELQDAVNTPGVISLLVVREPFVRLLSAYRDKLENITPPYYRKLARAIVAEHRAKAIKILGPIKSFGPTFYEFVAYLIQKYNAQANDFTFDEHWAPYYRFCSPCAVNFTVIAKVETLERDSAYVIQQLGLGHVLDRKLSNRRMRLRTVMNKSRDGKNTTALLRYYFSQIDEDMLSGLLQIYGIDFEMFGYDAKVYKRYVRK